MYAKSAPQLLLYLGSVVSSRVLCYRATLVYGRSSAHSCAHLPMRTQPRPATLIGQHSNRAILPKRGLPLHLHTATLIVSEVCGVRCAVWWVRTAELLAPRGCGGGPVAARLDVIIGTRPAVIVRLQRRAVAVFGAGRRQTLHRNMLFQLCRRKHARLRSEQASEAGAADLYPTRFELAHRVAGGVHLAADRPGAARHLLVPGPSVPLEQCAGWCSGGLWAPHLFR